MIPMIFRCALLLLGGPTKGFQSCAPFLKLLYIHNYILISFILGWGVFLLCWDGEYFFYAGMGSISFMLGWGVFLLCWDREYFFYAGIGSISFMLGMGVFLLCWDREYFFYAGIGSISFMLG